MKTETYTVSMRRFESTADGVDARLLIAALVLVIAMAAGYVMLSLVVAGVIACVMAAGRLMADFTDWWGAVGEALWATGRLALSLAFLSGSIGFLVFLARL